MGISETRDAANLRWKNEEQARVEGSKMQNELNQQRNQLDTLNKANRGLKGNIDKMRTENAQLNTVFNRMAKEVKRNRKKLNSVFSEHNGSNDTIDMLRRKAEALRAKRDQERREFKDDMTHLRYETRQADLQRKHGEVHARKLAMANGMRDKNVLLMSEEERNFDERQMMRRIMKLSFLNTIQRRKNKKEQKRIEVVEEAFATIKATTGISNFLQMNVN